MKPTDYAFLRDVLIEDSGVVLGPSKEYLVESRLGPVLRSDGYEDLDDLVRQLRAGRAGLRAKVVDCLTTHETYFFRDVHPFDALRTELLPSMIAGSPGRRVRIWSAAAATGQEPYSLAMMLHEHFPGVQVSILATDISGECVAAGRMGSFSQLEVNRGLPAQKLVKYFERDGLTWRVDPMLRDMVTFRELNLVRPWPVLPRMDVILLRNVLTYFDKDTRAAVLARAADVLQPGGVLFLGGSETTIGIDTGLAWTKIGKTVCYRKDGSADGRA